MVLEGAGLQQHVQVLRVHWPASLHVSKGFRKQLEVALSRNGQVLFVRNGPHELEFQPLCQVKQRPVFNDTLRAPESI